MRRTAWALVLGLWAAAYSAAGAQDSAALWIPVDSVREFFDHPQRIDSLILESTVPVPELRLGLSIFRGEAATRETLESIKRKIFRETQRMGFPFARFTVQALPSPLGIAEASHGITLWIRLQAGEGYKFGGWLAQETRTDPQTLLRLSTLAYGESFDEARIALAMGRFRRLGYYSAVDSLGLIRDPHRNLLYPVLRLIDDKANRLGGLLGYDSDAEQNQLSGYIDIHLVNIRGTARDFDFTFESRPQPGGRSDREARMEYVEPWLPGLPIGLRIGGSVWLQDSVYQQLDGSLALLQDLNFHSRLEVTLARQWSREFSTGEESEAYSGGMALLYDARNQVPFTLHGLRLRAGLTGIRRVLGDSSRFLSQTKAAAEIYHPLVGRLLAHIRWEGALDWPRRPQVIRGDRFDVGGARSLRGYREKEFSTDAYFYSDWELQWIVGSRGRLLLFAAPGIVNKPTPDIWWQRVFGYGLGLELGSQNWAIALLYALNPQRSPESGLLHIQVENRF